MPTCIRAVNEDMAMTKTTPTFTQVVLDALHRGGYEHTIYLMVDGTRFCLRHTLKEAKACRTPEGKLYRINANTLAITPIV